MPVHGPNVSRIRRAILLVTCEQALDAGDLALAEDAWIGATADYLTDTHVRTTHHPHDNPTEGDTPREHGGGSTSGSAGGDIG